MGNKRRTIGFDRTLELDWLDAAAAKVASGASVADVRKYLWEYLDGVVRGDTSNSGRGKTVTVLTHIWSRVPRQAEALRDRAAPLVSEVEPEERVALHWAMVTATYPYFCDVATTVGQLLKLQGDFSVPHITKRLGSRWGQRQLVERTAQHVTRTMTHWGALEATSRMSVFTQGRRWVVGRAGSGVLAEAVLIGTGEGSFPFERLASHPALYPFELSLSVAAMRANSSFAVHREGSAETVVSLR